MRDKTVMGPVAFAACGVFLAALSFGAGVAVGISLAQREAEREIRRLRLRVDSMRAELNEWRKRKWA